MQLQLDLYGEAPAPSVLHKLMPNMATACGRCTMWDCSTCERRIERSSPAGYVFRSSEVTCPECLAIDLERVSAAMQKNQAAVTA